MLRRNPYESSIDTSLWDSSTSSLAANNCGVYLTTELKLFPIPLGLLAGGSPLEIGATVCLWKIPTVDAIMERKLPVKAKRWFGVRFLVEVKGEPPQNWGSVFPRRIKKMNVLGTKTSLKDTNCSCPIYGIIGSRTMVEKSKKP